jgi:hypothetical protein
VKQNVVDVFLFAAVRGVVSRRRGARGWRRSAAFVLGSLAVLATATVMAGARGTSPAELWNAVVLFRVHGFAVIGASASAATDQRMWRLGAAFVRSGAAALLAVTVLTLLTAGHPRRRRSIVQAGGDPDPLVQHLTWPLLVMVGWELVGVAAGGSYWLHYLTGIIPGLVLLVSAVGPGRTGRLLVAAGISFALVTNTTAWVHEVTRPVSESTDAQVASYLRGRADPADGVVVAFGHPDIVLGSGLASPYPNLWSLPVRVRDPRLRELESVMSGPASPRWMVVDGDSLDSWGLDAADAQEYLQRHYVEQVAYGDWHIWQRERDDRG